MFVLECIDMAVRVGAPPILVCFSGDWDVPWGYLDFDPQPYIVKRADSLSARRRDVSSTASKDTGHLGVET